MTTAAPSARALFRPVPTWRADGVAAWLPALVMTLLLGALVLPPVAILVRTSLEGPAAGLTLEHYRALLSDPKLWSSAWNSVLFAFFATLVSLLIGGAQAWIVERTDAPLRFLANLTAVVSLGTPYVLTVGAWLFLLGRAGPLNHGYMALTGSGEPLFNVYSLSGMILIEGFLWSPLVFLMLSATFRRSNAELEEAARVAGATVLQTVWHVSLKLARPAIFGLFLFVFIRNIESFDVPVLIGTPSRINILTTDIYLGVTQTPPRLGFASAYATVLMVIVAGLLYLYGRLLRHADRHAVVTGKGFRPRPFALGRYRRWASALILANVMILLVLPLAAILWTALSPFIRPMTLSGLATLTLDNFRVVVDDPSSFRLAINTLAVSAAAATACMSLTVIAAWLHVRRWPFAGLLDQLTSVPLVFPGVVFGLAMIQIALRGPLPLYGTFTLIVFAFTIRYLPYGMRYAFNGVLQIHRELEEAAGVAGARQQQILARIVAPMLTPAISVGWMFIFLLASKELSMTVLLAGAHSKTMAVVIFDQFANGAAGEAAAIGFLWMLFMTCVAAALFAVMQLRPGMGVRA